MMKTLSRITAMIVATIVAATVTASCGLPTKTNEPQNEPQPSKSFLIPENEETEADAEVKYKPEHETNDEEKKEPKKILLDPQGKTVATRILTPEGYNRTEAGQDTFAEYLRSLPLKPHGSRVKLFDGREKAADVHEAVIDIDIGERDLQQCADAVIRLRAEYLYKTGQFEKIRFNFTSGFNAEYVKWMNGYRIRLDGNNASWYKRTGFSDEYEVFREYLNVVFAYAGTLSLSKELEYVDITKAKPGDVFIKGGTPGHAAIILDMAEDASTGKKLFLLAQSYMPAQDIHILKNPLDEELSPWYPANFGDVLVTPEWRFKREELMRFKD